MTTWKPMFSSQKRDLDRTFVGDYDAVEVQVRDLGNSRGYVVEVESMTDQIDVFTRVNGRRRRWMNLMVESVD